jgi:hypothetical protein
MSQLWTGPLRGGEFLGSSALFGRREFLFLGSGLAVAAFRASSANSAELQRSASGARSCILV